MINSMMKNLTLKAVVLLTVLLIFSTDARIQHLRSNIRRDPPTLNPQDADASTHALINDPAYPLPRSKMPDGFNSKVEFQTVATKVGDKTEFHERLVRCGIEKNEHGKEIFPCNPSFDVRPFVKGLDRVGSGFNILTGEKTTPIFEWSVPPYWKPVYDSGRYNTAVKIPEQVVLTSLPSGQAGVSTEMYQSYSEYQSKKSFSVGGSIGTIGLSQSFALSSNTQKMRSAFENYEIGISQQQYRLYELRIKPEIFGQCPYNSPVFTAETEQVNTAAAAPAAGNGIVPLMSVEDVGLWLKSIKLTGETIEKNSVNEKDVAKLDYVKSFENNGIDGSFLVDMKTDDLVDLGVTRQLDQHRYNFEFAKLLKISLDSLVEAKLKCDGQEECLKSAVPPYAQKLVEKYQQEKEGAEAEAAEEVEKVEEAEAEEAGNKSEEAGNKAEVVGKAEEEKANKESVNEDGTSKSVSVDPEDGPEPESIREFNFERPSYVRKYILRAGFMNAVNALPNLKESQIHQLCQDFDADIIETSKAMKEETSGGDEIRKEIAEAFEAEVEYRRFLFEWGTHYVRSAIMGGEVEITSMVSRKDITESQSKSMSSSSDVGADVEASVDNQELMNDDSESEVTEVVSVKNTDDTVKSDSDEESASGDTGEKSKDVVKQTVKKDSNGLMKNAAMLTGALGTGGATAAAPLIAEAVKNLKLKIDARYGSSSKSSIQITSSNNKNEVQFYGGDAQLNADEVGGDQFKLWKNTIRDDPVPVSKTIVPISDIMRQFAGPHADEQCLQTKSNEAFIKSKRRIKMVECMTRKLLRESKALSDITFEIGENEKEKYAIQEQIQKATMEKHVDEDKISKLEVEWLEICRTSTSLQNTKKVNTAALYKFSYREDAADSGGKSQECQHQLKEMMLEFGVNSPQAGKGKSSRATSTKSRSRSSVNGKSSNAESGVDECSLCKVMFEKASCLSTSAGNCGEAPRHKLVDVEAVIQEQVESSEHSKKEEKPACKLNENYVEKEKVNAAKGATPHEVNLWINKDTPFARQNKMTTSWMGWSAILFANKEVLCHDSENPLACQNWVSSKLREEICEDTKTVSLMSRKRLRLMTAIDFGVRGKTPDLTTATDACECAQFCTPDFNEETWYNDAKLWKKETGFTTNYIIKTNKDKFKAAYKSHLEKDSLAMCTGSRLFQEPMTSFTDSVAELGDSKSWDKKWASKNSELDKASCSKDTYVDELHGVFQARVSFPGHCKNSFSCKFAQLMNDGKGTRVSIQRDPKWNPNVPTLSVFNTEDEDWVESHIKSKQDILDNTKEIVQVPKFGQKWHEKNKFFDQYGMVYAELVQGAKNGLKKIVIVQGAVRTKEKSMFQRVNTYVKGKSKIAGRDLDNPTYVIELEDRDGSNMCMWLYHICCSMGGVLKHVDKDANKNANELMCSVGTVCCPKAGTTTEGGEMKLEDPSVPWSIDTVKVLRALSHGKIGPSMKSGEQLGFEDTDPISTFGPSQCMTTESMEKIFTEGEEKETEENEENFLHIKTVACRFYCRGKGKEICTNKYGKKALVLIRGHPEGKCEDKSMIPMMKGPNKMSAIPMAEDICKEIFIGGGLTCKFDSVKLAGKGFKETQLNELIQNEINGEDSKSTFTSEINEDKEILIGEMISKVGEDGAKTNEDEKPKILEEEIKTFSA